MDISCLEGFGKITFNLVKSIYREGWDNLLARDGSKLFWNKIKKEFTIRVLSVPTNRKYNRFPPPKPMEFTNISLPTNLSKSPKEGGAKPKLNDKPMTNLTILLPSQLILMHKLHLLTFKTFLN